MKLSNKIFYKRHKLELEKYTYSKNCLHIINTNSLNKFENDSTQKIDLDIQKESHLNDLNLNKKYEIVILTDILENHNDVYGILFSVKNLLKKDGKIIISSINTKYLFVIKILEFLKLKDSNKTNSYIHIKKINNITKGMGLEYQKYYTKQIFPFKFYKLGNLINNTLEILLSPFNLGIKTYMIFRPNIDSESKYSKSIIIPAKNEEGNLEELVDRIPKFHNTEIIFSYGNSKDKTLQVMESIQTKNQDFDIKVISQTKSGKANAVWEALDIVENEVIAILDADISVEPETLVDFFEIIDSNRADFINGTRLIYDMDKNSMRFLNKIGNRFFQFFVSRVIKEQLTDSLCGTKVFKKSYIKDLNLWQKKLWIEDPFGDFDMIFSAAYTGQKIVELPIYYKERRYGETQISRFKDGFKLLVYLGESFIRFNTSRNV